MTPPGDQEKRSFRRMPRIPIAQGRSNANQQSRELRKGESSRTRELAAQVGQRAYNLRPRNVNPATLQRRSELETCRMQQKQRRKQLAEESALHIKNKMQMLLDQFPKERQQSNRNNDEENDCRTEIFNAGGSALRNEWHPYHHAPDIGYSCTLKEASWEVEMSVLQIAPCVVALQSLIGDKQLFSCSGTIVEVSQGICFIVTVANLVKIPDADECAENLEIKVYMQKNEVLDGYLSSYDFYHNICVIEVTIARQFHLPGIIFSSSIWPIIFHESFSKDVVALSRDRRTHYLHVSTGKVSPKDSKLDCEELMVSSCKISKEAVGGPLMDFDGNIIGMNYYDSEETPFIPSFIVSECFLQLKKSCKVVRPWHGLRVRNIYAEGINGVVIKKVEDQFLEKAVDLYEGDIIDRVNGVKFSNAAELGAILLEIGAKHDDSKGMEMYLEFGLRDGRVRPVLVKNSTSDYFEKKKNSTSTGLNRWPFPKPIIVRHFYRDTLIVEEWFTLEC